VQKIIDVANRFSAPIQIADRIHDLTELGVRRVLPELINGFMQRKNLAEKRESHNYSETEFQKIVVAVRKLGWTVEQ
jgi:hypothetical protein